jgi:chromosome segregation ATPase
MTMQTTIDEVIETVRGAREDGPDALAAMALSYGATMVLGAMRCEVLRGQLREARAEREAAHAATDDARAERDEAQQEAEALRVDLDAMSERLGAARMEHDALRAAVVAWADADRTHDVIVRQRAVLSLLAAVERGPRVAVGRDELGEVTP